MKRHLIVGGFLIAVMLVSIAFAQGLSTKANKNLETLSFDSSNDLKITVPTPTPTP